MNETRYSHAELGVIVVPNLAMGSAATGAVAPLFPASDTATDARYDDYLATLGAAGDPDAFDDKGVVGTHGVERILWADRLPREVVDFEQGVPGFRAAAFPRTEAEATAFKQKLLKKLVQDGEK